ncbi:MAG: DUF1624 domain-containing protein [archaeon]|nr:DUF1624 domain-containing protein [archaeon]
MKRYTSLDLLRGAAIVGVICFHLLNVSYDYTAVLDESPPFWFYLLVIFLGYMGAFDVMFICLSALVNIISVDRQWKKALEKDTNEEGKKKAFKKIMKGQIIRGLFIITVGYVAESLLNGLLLKALLQEENLIGEAINPLFYTQVLVMIGLSVIICSFIYLSLLKMGKNKREITTILMILGCAIIFLTPLITEIMRALGFPERPSTGWEERNILINILYFILTPLVTRFTPIFPNLGIAIFGVIIGYNISEGKIEKKFLNKVIYGSIGLFIIGIIEGIIGEPYDLTDFLMASAGGLLLIVMLLYFVEVRGKGKKFAENKVSLLFRRFGFITLTIWCLQWVVIIPISIIQLILNLMSGLSTPILDGPFLNQGLNGWELWGLIFIVVPMYHLILWIWEKIEFKGSLEWITVKLLSKGRPDAEERLQLSKVLHDVEPFIEEEDGQNYYGRGIKIFLFILFSLYAIIYAVLVLL